MTKRILGIVKEVKGGKQRTENVALQTHTAATPPRKRDTAKASVIITTRDVAKKGK